MATGGQPLTIGADGDAAHIVERPHSEHALRSRDGSIVLVGFGHDLAQSVLVDSAVTPWQWELPRRSDAQSLSIRVELNRPPPHADRPAGEQVARWLEHQVLGGA